MSVIGWVGSDEEGGFGGAGAAGRLASFLDAVSASTDVTAAMEVAAEHTRRALAAERAVVTRGALSASSTEAPSAAGRSASIARPLGPEGGELRVVRSRPFDAAETALLASMAKVLGLAIALLENREHERTILASLQERQALLERLARIQRSIFHRAPLQDVLDGICAGAAELLGADVVALRLRDPHDRSQLVTVASVGLGPTGSHGPKWPTKAFDDAAAPCPRHGREAAMAASIFEGGSVVGNLTVAACAPGRRYGPSDRDVLQAFAEHAGLALNDARTVEALRTTRVEAVHEATHDPLTGLVNRAVILERLAERLDGSDVEGVAVLFVDLDRFKLVNDSLGHDLGDRVLVATADRLQRCVRPGDVVGRHAGDEFVVVCSGLQGEVDALGLADRICRAIAAPMELPSRELVVTASVGVARGVRGVTADGLLRDADLAMYQAKERGRDRTEMFGRSMRARMLERVELEHSLRRAILCDEFLLHYQPTLDLGTGRPGLVEALLRWEHPERGLVPPDQFIPVAEDTRMIVPIGAWALQEACRQVATWRSSTPALDDLQVSVNLSACQFGDEKLVELVAAALEESGLDPGALWLEITETAVMDDVATTIRTLSALKELGVHLAIDDFGTGYSSLSYLKRFPVDVLKIDRSFVDGIGTDSEDTALVTAVVRLAQALGKGVVAEGIEHESQLSALRELGCEAGQGYLFAPPRPADATYAWLVERRSG